MVEVLEVPTSTTTKRCTRTKENQATMVTNLYEIISAVQDSLEPGDEDLLVPTVMRILQSGQAAFVRDLKAQEN